MNEDDALESIALDYVYLPLLYSIDDSAEAINEMSDSCLFCTEELCIG